jgi:hypothetical protein
VAIAYVSGAGAYTQASPTTVAAPASIVAGNLLVAVLYSSSGTTTAHSAPTGWTRVGSQYSTVGTTAGTSSVWTKIATASEPSSYAFVTGGFASIAVLQYSGTTAVDGLPAFTNGSGTSATTSAALTATAAGETQVAAFGSWNGAGWGAPSGMASRASVFSNGNSSEYVYDVALTAAGAAPARTSVQGASGPYVTTSFLLAPAGTAGPAPVTVAASLTGTGALAATSTVLVTPQVSVAAAVAGSGVLTAVAAPRVTVAGTATAATGTLTAVGVPSVSVPAAVAVSGTLTAVSTMQETVPAALGGTGTLTAVSTMQETVPAALGGTGTLTAALSIALTRDGTLTGAGVLAAGSSVDEALAVVIFAAGTLTASAAVAGPTAATPADGGCANSDRLATPAVVITGWSCCVAGLLVGATIASVTWLTAQGLDPEPVFKLVGSR